MRVYICENSKENLIQTQDKLLEVVNRTHFDVQIITSTYFPETFIRRISSESNGVYIISLEMKNQSDGLELAQLIRTTDPRGYIILIVDQEGNYLQIIESQVEVLDLLNRSNDAFSDELESCLKYIQKKDDADALFKVTG